MLDSDNGVKVSIRNLATFILAGWSWIELLTRCDRCAISMGCGRQTATGTIRLIPGSTQMIQSSLPIAVVVSALFVALLLHRRLKDPRPLLPTTAARCSRTINSAASRHQRGTSTKDTVIVESVEGNDASAVILVLPPDQDLRMTEDRPASTHAQARDLRAEPGLQRVTSEFLVSPPALKPIRTG